MLEISDAIKTNNRRCNICNKILGYFIKKNKKGKEVKCYFFSITPWVFEDILYYRCLCADCFFEKFNRLPSAAGMITYDYEVLLNVQRDIINIVAKNRAVTLENLQKKYGKEEGQIRFNTYKEKQSIKNTFKFKKEKYGWTKEEFKEFNNSRAVTLENLQKKYGKEEGQIRFNAYKEKQKYVGCKLEYFIEKLGFEDGTEKYKEINKLKPVTLDNMFRVHGEDLGQQKYLEYLEKIKKGNSNSVSKISQTLFYDIYNSLSNKLKEKTYFGNLNNEYVIIDDKSNRGYSYDFINEETMTCIEFNGEHCHVNVSALTDLELTLWVSAYNKKRAAEVIEFDNYKNSLIKNKGFSLKIVWAFDYIHNPKKVLFECIDFITSKHEGINYDNFFI